MKSFLALGVSVLLLSSALPAHATQEGIEPPPVTKERAKKLSACLETYKEKCSRYPRTLEGLDGLLPTPNSGSHPCAAYEPCVLAKKVKTETERTEFRQDGLGHDFIYISNGESYEIHWRGKDGKQDLPFTR